ncbi:MAG TPA: S8 family peptidase [Solirubrobacterales bacterium]|nr:S8 family peptidase [Solirubrobacterales bacterium]
MDQAVALLSPQLERLQEDVGATPTALRGSRVVFEATVSPNYLANSYFPSTLFREADLVPVGTRGALGEYRTAKKVEHDCETKTYLLAADERALAKVSALLHGRLPSAPTLNRARDSLRQFEMLRLPPVEETLRAPAETTSPLLTWEAVFHPLFDGGGVRSASEWQSVLAKWQTLVSELGGEIRDNYIRTIKGLTFMPVRLPAEAAEAAARFNPLRTMRPMPGVRPNPVSPLRIQTTEDDPPNPPAADRPQSDLRVAVFDGGIDGGVPHLSPFVSAVDLTTEAADSAFVAHGTLVTSTVLYGARHAEAPLRTPEVGVDHYRVLPVPPADVDLELYWILDRIAELVEQGNHRIINLSLGPEFCVDDDDEPHAWTARLDELAERLDVLFVSAVGNNGQRDPATGANRIQVPSDMANGIGVGACDKPEPDDDWSRAPYSAVGPGRPGCRMQPTGVAFGGVGDRPFRGITSGGIVGEAEGTSFATPCVVHALAGLSATLGAPGLDPRLLRAFAVHGASPADPFDPENSGFGRIPERFDTMLECPPNEATVLYRDSISRGEAVSLPFPLDEAVVAGRTVSMRWTIVLSAPTDPRNPVEYTQAGVEVSFRPHAQRFTFYNRDTKHSKVVDVGTEQDEAAQLMREGYEFSGLPATRSPNRHRHEAQRRRDESKWETILHARSRMRASGLLRPQLTVTYLAREEGVLTDAPPLDFVMLLTMHAPKGVDLYDAVRVKYPQLTPLHTRLPLRLSI